MGKGSKKAKLLSKGVVARNKAARHEYELIETFEAGMVLLGSEVKAMRAREASLQESFAYIKNGELWLMKAYVPPWEYSAQGGHDPYRQRKLLLHRREIRNLLAQVKIKGITIVPLELYFNDRGIAKLKLAVARGKKLHDKRESLKKREAEQEIRQV